MPNRRIQTVAIAGAAAISASLIGFAALQDTPQPAPETHAVTLTAGEADIFLPDGNFQPTVAEGFPPFFEVLQGTDGWGAIDLPPHTVIAMNGIDTQTTIGPFVNDDFLASTTFDENAVGPAVGTEVDLANFGGGFENEWLNLVDENGGHTVTDIIITPFGNYTIPLGTTVAEVAAAAPADALSGVEASIQFNTSAAETAFGLAQTAFADGEYPLAFSQALDGFNNLTVGVADDLLVNGYIGLTGGTDYAEFIFVNPGQPADLAVAFAQASDFLAQGQGLLTDALGDFGSGDTVSALTELAGIGTDSTYATDAIILGLFDVLTGAGISA